MADPVKTVAVLKAVRTVGFSDLEFILSSTGVLGAVKHLNEQPWSFLEA